MVLDGKKDVHLDGSPIGTVSRLEVLEGPTGRRVRSEAERARIVAESLLPGAQVSEVARKPGATRWQIYDWRRRFRQRGRLAVVRISDDKLRTAGCGRAVRRASRSGGQA
jgi:transposase